MIVFYFTIFQKSADWQLTLVGVKDEKKGEWGKAKRGKLSESWKRISCHALCHDN